MHLKFKVTYTLTLLNPIAKQVRSKIMSENQYDLVILGGGTGLCSGNSSISIR